VPTTPETVKGTESPDPAAAAPTEDNESNVAAIQKSQQQDEGKPATTTTKSKKKHRTRISVTTQENDEEEGEDEDDDDSSAPEIETFEAVDDRNISDEGDSQMMELNTTVDSAVNETGVDSTFDEEQAPDDEDKTSKNLLDTFEGCDILPDSLKAMLPESWQQTTATEETVVEEPPKKMSYYSDEFATNFLQELLKNGFALVYHQPSLTIEEENADWQGRSVTMNFKPGVCNALEVFQPEIEWSTMGGGKDKKILTRSVSMLDIHSIAVSSTNDMRDNLEAGEQEEIQCFFTMTTKSGDIHVLRGNGSEFATLHPVSASVYEMKKNGKMFAKLDYRPEASPTGSLIEVFTTNGRRIAAVSRDYMKEMLELYVEPPMDYVLMLIGSISILRLAG